MEKFYKVVKKGKIKAVLLFNVQNNTVKVNSRSKNILTSNLSLISGRQEISLSQYNHLKSILYSERTTDYNEVMADIRKTDSSKKSNTDMSDAFAYAMFREMHRRPMVWPFGSPIKNLDAPKVLIVEPKKEVVLSRPSFGIDFGLDLSWMDKQIDILKALENRNISSSQRMRTKYVLSQGSKEIVTGYSKKDSESTIKFILDVIDAGGILIVEDISGKQIARLQFDLLKQLSIITHKLT